MRDGSARRKPRACLPQSAANVATLQKSDDVAATKQHMVAASYLPVICAACAKIQLQSMQPGQTPSCRTCGGITSVLPGERYAESDTALFERIETAVRPLVISRRTAERVVAELRDVALRAGAPEAILLRVVDFLPTLHFLIPALYLQPTPALERALLGRAAGMLQTIIAARLRGSECSRAS
jgi:hypothetical protein